MPTSTFPLWWTRDNIVALLNAARDGASYQELDQIIRDSLGGNWRGKLRNWVMAWKDRPTDQPQARLAAMVHAYDPPASREKKAMQMVEEAIAIHRSACECGSTKDHPDDLTCRACAVLEGADPGRDRAGQLTRR